MQVEDTKHDLELQIVALKAFENILDSTTEVEQETLNALLDIFHIIWPLYKECLVSPPPDTSKKMLECLKAMDDRRHRNRSRENTPGMQEPDDIAATRETATPE